MRQLGRNWPSCTDGPSSPRNMTGNKLAQLQTKLNDAIRKQQYTKIAKLQSQIKEELKRKEHVALGTLLPLMNEEQTEEALRKMHKLFITADLLYGFAMEFEDTLHKYDPSMETHVVKKVRQIADLARGITRNVDAFNDEKLSENFGNMCDEAGFVIENIIYKYRQKEIVRINQQKQE